MQSTLHDSTFSLDMWQQRYNGPNVLVIKAHCLCLSTAKSHVLCSSCHTPNIKIIVACRCQVIWQLVVFGKLIKMLVKGKKIQKNNKRESEVIEKAWLSLKFMDYYDTCEFLNSENSVNSTWSAWILLLCTGMSRIPVKKNLNEKQFSWTLIFVY